MYLVPHTKKTIICILNLAFMCPPFFENSWQAPSILTEEIVKEDKLCTLTLRKPRRDNQPITELRGVRFSDVRNVLVLWQNQSGSSDLSVRFSEGPLLEVLLLAAKICPGDHFAIGLILA